MIDDKEKFVVRISCEPKITPTDISAEIVDKMLTLRVEKVNEIVISQLRDLMREKGINELIAIDESKALEMVKKAQAFDIVRNKDVNIFLFKECCANEWKMPYSYNQSFNKRKQLTEEESDLLKEVLL